MILLSAAQSRELDRLSQQKYGVDSYALMTNAGDAVARTIARQWPDAMARGVLVVAGKGNNGGDGLVAARRLYQAGERVRAVLLARQTDLRGDAARAAAGTSWLEAFAGPDISRAVFYPEDDQYLIDRDLTAQHYDVADPD